MEMAVVIFSMYLLFSTLTDISHSETLKLVAVSGYLINDVARDASHDAGVNLVVRP